MILFFDQTGYRPEEIKRIYLEDVDNVNEQLHVLDEKGDTVFSAPIEGRASDEAGKKLYIADLTAFTQEGCYTLQIGEQPKTGFVIGKDVHKAVFSSLGDMFYLQRCGCELKTEAGLFAHAACHTGPAQVWGSEEQVDVSGGWHDAGDYGRYIVPAAKACADLMYAYMAVPEQFDGLKLTEIREEILWEMDWMLKMQRADGGVWHKVSCAHFCGMIMPEEQKDPLFISPVSTTATADFAACMALGARFFAKDRPEKAAQMHRAALRAKAFLDKNPPILFKNPEGITTGGYGGWTDKDDRFWAAAELAVLTGDEKALQEAEAGLMDPEIHCTLGWGDMSGYGVAALMSLKGEKTKGLRDQARKKWLRKAAELLQRAENTPWGTTLSNMFPWGSNMMIANDGVILVKAAQMTEGEESRRLHTAAENQLHYLLGANPLGVCYVTGNGQNPVRHPHHRPSAARGQAMPGMLVGGPCSHLADDTLKKAFTPDTSAIRCYADETASYASNEICIYWNSPLIWMMAELH